MENQLMDSATERQIGTVIRTLGKKREKQQPKKILNSQEWQQKWFQLENTHFEVANMMNRAEFFVKRVIMRCLANPKLLVIAGRSGCGKTSVARGCFNYACALSITAWEKGWWINKTPSVGFYEWSWMASTTKEERDDLWRDAVESDFTILDDVGSESDPYKSGVPTENLRLMLGAREGKFTLVTTNIPPRAWDDKWDARVHDRLLRRSEIVELAHAPSWAALQHRN